MENKRKVLISGYYGFNNSGDDAILKAIVNDLKRLDKNIEISVLSGTPEATEKIYKIKAINRINFFKVVKAINEADLLISGGGSLLQDVTSTRSILYYLAVMAIAKILRKSVMVYANGIGPINKKINRFLTRVILNNVDLITLRDYNSKKTLEDLNVKKKCLVTSDPVFTLIPSEDKRINDILESEKIPTDKKLIGISIRDWENSENLKRIVAETIHFIKNKYDANIIFIPMHYPEDLKISNDIAKMAKNNSCYVLKNNYSVEDIMGIVSKLEFIIAMRLHSLIYAATQSVPMIGITYDPKIDGFLDLIELEYRCDINTLELEDLCDKVEKVWNNREVIKENLYKLNENLKDKALDNVMLALDILKIRREKYE
ncbi:polysaccharide pyruvyl transferase [Gottschalkia purinilytica]|uniref:Polysaccharide pyruvyl transferase n=1 Tax=Gottschalkia purinilytica TaxID=1503 RepID=A0A0L0WCG6_GOTPU|nr:polysaccharide pyruvyl transferase CsaB [Gottschalkia purinilytica]KNF09174.1 polysaccharide pyruvyl transferase [Gottschalkia purinilytica]